MAILVNALHLKIGWQTAFPAHVTGLRPFHAPGGVVEVSTMKLTTELGYTRHDGWQTIALPTKQPGIEALVLLPDTSLEQPLDPSVFRVDGDARVALSLPKVDVRAKFELSEKLRRLEGAAATAVLMTRGARPAKLPEPIVVTVDRPFLLAVRNARSRAIYFLAQVARP